MKFLGPDYGFGYLADDDDGDSSGGGLGDTFNAVPNNGGIPTGTVGAAFIFYVAASASSAQTGGSFKVTIDGSGTGLVSAVTTGTLAGWSESGWSLLGDTWSNTFTKSSISSGTTTVDFYVTTTRAGTVTVGTTSPHPATTQASGGGGTVSVDFVVGETLDFNTSASPDPVADLGFLTISIDAVVGGGAQTNLYAEVRFDYEDDHDVVFNGRPSVVDADGWTVDLSNIGDGLWLVTLTRSSADVGTTTVILSARPYKNGHTTLSILASNGYSDQVDPASYSNNSVSFS